MPTFKNFCYHISYQVSFRRSFQLPLENALADLAENGGVFWCYLAEKMIFHLYLLWRNFLRVLQCNYPPKFSTLVSNTSTILTVLTYFVKGPWRPRCLTGLLELSADNQWWIIVTNNTVSTTRYRILIGDCLNNSFFSCLNMIRSSISLKNQRLLTLSLRWYRRYMFVDRVIISRQPISIDSSLQTLEVKHMNCKSI